MPTVPFEAGGMLSPQSLPHHIIAKIMFARHEMLDQYCESHAGSVRRA